MKNMKIDGTEADLRKLQEVHEKRMSNLFNVRGFFLAADVALLVLMAPVIQGLPLEDTLKLILVDISFMLAVFTLICIVFSFKKDVRQPGELFVNMVNQLAIAGRLDDGITAASNKWYEDLSCKAWPILFGFSMITFIVAMVLAQIRYFFVTMIILNINWQR